MDSLRGSSVKIGTIQRRLAWPLRKDDTQKSRMYHFLAVAKPLDQGRTLARGQSPAGSGPTPPSEDGCIAQR